MMLKKILQLLLIAITVIALSACSSTKGTAVTTDGYGNDGSATASGVGDVTSFDNSDADGGSFGNDPMKVGNQNYYFDYDQSSVHNSDVASIQVQAHYLATHPKARVLLTGNTDERGSREYNIGLGERRANSVAAVLEANGVAKNQITVVSYGAEKPVGLAHNESSYAKNRRVDLIYRK